MVWFPAQITHILLLNTDLEPKIMTVHLHKGITGNLKASKRQTEYLQNKNNHKRSKLLRFITTISAYATKATTPNPIKLTSIQEYYKRIKVTFKFSKHKQGSFICSKSNMLLRPLIEQVTNVSFSHQ